MTILDEIVVHKLREVERREREAPLEEVAGRARRAGPPRGFERALREASGGASCAGGGGEPRPAVIAEVKRASPSRGEIRADFVPEAIAASYERAGAAAISVLTDERYFGGRLEHLEAVRRAVRVPVLRKDFILREYQVWESRAAGADAILLILAAVREDRTLAELAARAEELGMDVLWEVHDREELRRVLRFGPRLVGVNNRDLRTFEVSLETTKSLVPELPREVFAVSESGFSSAREIEEVFRAGARGFLVGESLLREPDPGGALSRLLGSGGGAPWT